MDDSELDHLIRQSRSVPEFPASFQRDIWTRIAALENRSWPARWYRRVESFVSDLARPFPAFSLVILSFATGAALGLAGPGNSESPPSRESYLVSIDPLRLHELPANR